MGRLPKGGDGYLDMGKWLIPGTWLALAWSVLVMAMMTLPAVNHVAGEYFVYIEAVGVLWLVLVRMRRLRKAEAGPAREPAAGLQTDEVNLAT
jgi:hypothetical protein